MTRPEPFQQNRPLLPSRIGDEFLIGYSTEVDSTTLLCLLMAAAKEKGIFQPAISGENPTALRQVDAVPVQQSPTKESVKAKQASPPAEMHILG